MIIRGMCPLLLVLLRREKVGRRWKVYKVVM